MAFYIDLDKIAQTDEYVRYKFYTSEHNVGVIELNFQEEKFKEITPAPEDKNGLYFERAAWAIAKRWKNRELPDQLCWAS